MSLADYARTLLQRNRAVIGGRRADAAFAVDGVVVDRAAPDAEDVDQVGGARAGVNHNATTAVRFGLLIGSAVGFDNLHGRRRRKEPEVAGRSAVPQELFLFVHDHQVMLEGASDTCVQGMVAYVSQVRKDLHPFRYHGDVEGVRVVMTFRLVKVHQEGGRSGEIGLEHAIVAGVEDCQQPAGEEPVAHGRRRRGFEFRGPVEEGERVPRVHADERGEIVAQTHETQVVNPRGIGPLGRPFAGVGDVGQPTVGQRHQGPRAEYRVIGASRLIQVEVFVAIVSQVRGRDPNIHGRLQVDFARWRRRTDSSWSPRRCCRRI